MLESVAVCLAPTACPTALKASVVTYPMVLVVFMVLLFLARTLFTSSCLIRFIPAEGLFIEVSDAICEISKLSIGPL
jgi:hypothetical protein